MKRNWPLTISATLYFINGALFIIALIVKINSPDIATIVVTGLISLLCFYFGYAALAAKTGSFSQKKNFGITAGLFCGIATGIAGPVVGIVLGIPLLFGLLGIREILWHGSEG